LNLVLPNCGYDRIAFRIALEHVNGFMEVELAELPKQRTAFAAEFENFRKDAGSRNANRLKSA
jgi:hypothetical protein